ncbi:MAG: preprotein translocase subunit Sec61beta [Candidatus Nanoarchaeia archaeon]|jgi:preprotein translocase subunit Sec61beta|nr:preprotein translocase subunit Sec61beta [Candidatus Nanoarchaeia archaeon]MDD3993643.1 preprotein translocase subunit Sec61beta [Candidatus Nanoarchaeia archaeon]MDD4563617.1 preprotein translocase subunit Sec61beta [Candidatus Nanoarchaeia archaeon]
MAEIGLPGTGGLMHFKEEYKSKIQLKPSAIVTMIILTIILEIVLHFII